MPFSVDDFKARIDGHLAHPAYFRVLFSGAIVSAEPSRNLAFLCNQAQLPGRAFATMEYTTHGPIRKVPYQNIYDDVVLSFYVREDMGVKELFQEWQNFICDNNTDSEFSYFDDYVTDIIIEQYDSTGQSTYACRLIDAYPLMVAPVQMDWADKDSFMNLQVTFAYRYWRKEPLDINPFGNQLNVNDLYPNFDVSGTLNKFGAALFSRADGQFSSTVDQGINFMKNMGRQSGRVSNQQPPNAGFRFDNFFTNLF